MKKIVTSIVLAMTVTFGSLAQSNIPVDFDECVDMMCAVWRLAGAREYDKSKCLVEPMNESFEKHFANVGELKAVKLAKKYYSQGLGYDGVAALGTYLDIKDGKVVYDEHLDQSNLAKEEERWPEERQKEMVEALNEFYTKTQFHEWYESNAALYAQVKDAFSVIADMVDTGWFGSFFSKEKTPDFHIKLCLLAGVNNYGLSEIATDGTHVLTPVISSAHYADGKIVYNPNTILPIVIHEFCHAYCNPLIDKYWEKMEVRANEVFEMNSDLLSQQAYTRSKIMMYEIFVRASVIRYMVNHFTPQQVNGEMLIKNEEELGFLLTRTMFDALKVYEDQKSEYSNMESYMEPLINAINVFDVEKYKADMKAAEALKVHYTCNIQDGQKDVPSGDITLTITFDRPMEPNIGLGLTQADFPSYIDHKWSDDQKTVSIKLHTEPKHEYGFRMLGSEWKAKDGQSAVDDVVYFKTK